MSSSHKRWGTALQWIELFKRALGDGHALAVKRFRLLRQEGELRYAETIQGRELYELRPENNEQPV